MLCGSAVTGLGVEMLMQTILDLAPWPRICPPRRRRMTTATTSRWPCDPNGPTAAIVFKTISDQYGKYSMVKVHPWQDHQRYGPV